MASLQKLHNSIISETDFIAVLDRYDDCLTSIICQTSYKLKYQKFVKMLFINIKYIKIKILDFWTF